MKRILLLLCAFIPTVLGAQIPNVIYTRPAHPEGRTLTMQDITIRNARLYPARDTFHYAPAERPKAFPGIASEEAGIVYGETVSRHEFNTNTGHFWNHAGDRVAFYRKEERQITDFPFLDIDSRTGELFTVKYPMNAMPSEHLSLGVLTPADGRIVYMQVTDFDEERYLTNITWSPDDRYLFIQVVDRAQHHMHLNMYRSADGAFVRTLLTEDNEAWVEPLDPLYFLRDSWNFIYRTDNRDAYHNLYLCDTLGTLRRLTPTDAEIEYVDHDGRDVYYYSFEVSPAERHLYRIDARRRNARPQRLTAEPGWHTVVLNPDCSQFLDSWSHYDTPRVICTRKTDGKLIETLFEAPDPMADYAKVEMEFGTVPSADGRFRNHYRLFKPLGFDPSKKYPLIVYVYGGPHSQMVNSSWLGNIRMWEMAMAQRGYVVYAQDNRGTPYHGAEYEKAINRRCGQVEMEDQMAGISLLLDEPWVDRERVGVHGCSYGGFMTISLMTHYPEVFKVGVAGGPVIDWKWYEVMYGERYMDTPQTNPEGFASTSLMNQAANLKGKLLICQGAVDNTVVWQHSLNFVQKCIEEGVQLDYFPYPRSEHNVSGIWRVHLHDKITRYFEDYL